MAAGAQARPGLWERKKARTRTEIREQALRLFREIGYEATTVERIAEAAEVSPSTVFRYFPTKALLVVPFDLATVIQDAFRGQSSDVPPIEVLRLAMLACFDQFAELGDDVDIPPGERPIAPSEAREALLGQITGAVGFVAELIAERWGLEPHDLRVQAIAGAALGIAVAAWTADRDVGRAQALGILDLGLRSLEAGFGA